MPWFNVDDGFANSKPVMRIPRRYRASCIGVWTLCGSWSAKELTDGLVSNEVVQEYGGTPKIVELLIDSGLWEDAGNGVQFRNWSKWQRTKQQVLDYRAAEADRKRNRRNANRQTTDQPEPETSAECPTGTPDGHPPGHHADSGIPIPKPKPTPIPKPLVVTKGGEQTSVAAHTTDEPPKFCPRHMPSGTLAACGACAEQRKRHETWRTAQTAETQRTLTARTAARVAARRAAAATRQDAINDCPHCTDDGYRNGIVCDHIDRTNTARNGMAAVRAALGQPHQLDDEGTDEPCH